MSYQSYILDAAKRLQMDPIDLATIVSYETAGSFSPTQPGPTTKWGQHRGWLQWGEPQAREYGVDFNNPQAQADAMVKYFLDRGWRPDMGTLDAYSIVNAGRPGLYNAVDNGSTVQQKVASFGPHRRKAERWLGQRFAPVSDTIADAVLPEPPPGYEYDSEPEPRSDSFKIEVTPGLDVPGDWESLDQKTIKAEPMRGPPPARSNILPAIAQFFNDVGRVNAPRKPYDPLSSVQAPQAPYDPLSSVQAPQGPAAGSSLAKVRAPNWQQNTKTYRDAVAPDQRRMMAQQSNGLAGLFG